MTLMLGYSFSQEEADAAAAEWGCNCGPAALAFAIQSPLAVARRAIPEFEARRYTSPTMMKQALGALRVPFTPIDLVNPAQVPHSAMFADLVSLVRIQFTGPWTAPGANPKWAYQHTHWITTWMNPQTARWLLFDVNGGILRFGEWSKEIVPLLAKGGRRDGGWFPSHVWRLDEDARRRAAFVKITTPVELRP